MPLIPVSGPWITQRELDLVGEATASGWYEGANRYQERFEGAFAAYVGVRHAVALPSCTSAIHLALLALGVGPGDEVIVPEITWIASAAPIHYVGATPVFADVDAQTWCMSVESAEARITSRTKAIVPVDLYGGSPDLVRLEQLCRERGIALIEDAAQAVGTERSGRRAGSFGDAGVFSFHGSKTLTTGEGGMLVTNRADVHARCLFLRDHGRKPGPKMFYNDEIAYKYKMSAMQAALGLAQLERVDQLVDKKREIFGWYRERGASLPGLTWNVEPNGTKNAYWMVTVVLDESHPLEKEEVMGRLLEAGVDSRPFFYPLSSLPAYATLSSGARERSPIAYAVSPRGINLPSALRLERDDVDAVCAALEKILR